MVKRPPSDVRVTLTNEPATRSRTSASLMGISIESVTTPATVKRAADDPARTCPCAVDAKSTQTATSDRTRKGSGIQCDGNQPAMMSRTKPHVRILRLVEPDFLYQLRRQAPQGFEFLSALAIDEGVGRLRS